MNCLQKINNKISLAIESIIRFIVICVKAPYYRRKSQYTHTGKIALCCIAKMENEYIRFFVEYYKDLCFDKIFIYDNNSPDGEQFEEVIGDYINSGYVEVVDYRGQKVAQLLAYQDCYDKYNKEYDWIAFFDCDEFLTFAGGPLDVHEFLSQRKFLPFQVLHVNWQVYGDNELLDNDGRSVTERFIMPIPFNTKGRYGTHLENEHVKSLVRGGLSAVVWRLDPHTPKNDYYRCCSPEGNKVDLNSPFKSIDYGTLFLRHYSTKTIGEWVKNKMRRGIPDRSADSWKGLLNLDYFFWYNTKTEEKMNYAMTLFRETDGNK